MRLDIPTVDDVMYSFRELVAAKIQGSYCVLLYCSCRGGKNGQGVSKAIEEAGQAAAIEDGVLTPKGDKNNKSKNGLRR